MLKATVLGIGRAADPVAPRTRAMMIFMSFMFGLRGGLRALVDFDLCNFDSEIPGRAV
jgi:hypothetical protein